MTLIAGEEGEHYHIKTFLPNMYHKLIRVIVLLCP